MDKEFILNMCFYIKWQTGHYEWVTYKFTSHSHSELSHTYVKFVRFVLLTQKNVFTPLGS